MISEVLESLRYRGLRFGHNTSPQLANEMRISWNKSYTNKNG